MVNYENNSFKITSFFRLCKDMYFGLKEQGVTNYFLIIEDDIPSKTFYERISISELGGIILTYYRYKEIVVHRYSCPV